MFKAKHSLTIAVGLWFLLERSLIITPITKKVPTTIAGIFYYAKQLLKRHCMRTKRQGRLHRPCRCLFISKKQKRRKKRASRTLFRCSTRSDLAEMGECHSCTQHPVLLQIAISAASFDGNVEPLVVPSPRTVRYRVMAFFSDQQSSSSLRLTAITENRGRSGISEDGRGGNKFPSDRHSHHDEKRESDHFRPGLHLRGTAS